MTSLSQLILDGIAKAQAGLDTPENLYQNTSIATGKNEFLFFIKPELTLPEAGLKTEMLVDFALQSITHFGLKIKAIKALPAEYLRKYNIIAQHYGVINKLATDAANNLSQAAREKFGQVYGFPTDTVKLMGGVEFLAKYPQYNAQTLNDLWASVPNTKLAGGTYCEIHQMDGQKIYVINGFHPSQLEHFVARGRSIVVMQLIGDVSWTDARNRFIGATNPAQALPGSLRRELLEHKDEMGVQEVSQGANGFHLSAGPVEALVELRRYLSDMTQPEGMLAVESFEFGSLMQKQFGSKTEEILSNPNVEVDGKSTSVFDLTEEKDSDVAIQILSEYF